MSVRNNIGVFICHCGLNIAGVIDIEKVRKKLSEEVYAEDYVFLCSEPGQKMMKERIKSQNLDGVVISACSPSIHQQTFRNLAFESGINPYRCEIANIREQCSWAHIHEPDKATKKSYKIIKSTIEKLKQNKELYTIKIPVKREVLVIGGGITGIQTSLDLANAGIKVHLVERQQSIGGIMSQLSETFPTLDCPQCIMTPKMTEVAQHPLITLYAYSEIDDVSGTLGDFKVKIRRKPAYVDWTKCTGCGRCIEKCPTKVPSEFDLSLSFRKSIYTLFPQAVPNKPVIDSNHCLYLTKGRCGVCEKVCTMGAIEYNQKEKVIEVNVGAIVVCTGLRLFPKERIGEYGYGKYKDVVDALQFERLLAPAGPTYGIPKRISDGKVAKEVVFVQCVGSRDLRYNPYCSRICCMYIGKQAMLYKHAVPDGQAYVFYIDIRSAGKDYEEFIQRAVQEYGVIYLRGKVSKLFEQNCKIVVWGVDTLTGKGVELEADMVVLGMACIPSEGIEELARKLRIPTKYGWLTEAHLKLRPFETLTPGVFIAGAAQYPKDITDCVAQGSACAAKILAIFGKEYIEREPTIAYVEKEICSGCGICVTICPYDAIEIVGKVAKLRENLCEGCGSCSATCPSGAIQIKNVYRSQIFEIVDTVITETMEEE